MVWQTGYALTAPPSREGRRGRVAKIDDPAFRRHAVTMAATGSSRRRVAASLGIGAGRLCEWLARGRANPDLEPWGSFADEYLAAEQMMGALGDQCEASRMAHLARLPASVLTTADMRWIAEYQERRYPEQRGQSNLRVVETEPDAEAWWAKQGLVGEQLRALLRDPPESLDQAMLAEGDAMVLRMLRNGWSPGAEVRAAITKGK